MKTSEIKQVHRNIPQMDVMLVNAKITAAIFARATGKTHGVSAPFGYDRTQKLPCSTGFFCSPSYTHLIDTIVPQVQQGWADYGLKEGVHYWLYEKPPKELEIPEPFLPVDKPKYYIFFINGSVIKLVSLDRKALVNSKSFDWGIIFEARKCPEQVVQDDLIPTLRGGRVNPLPDKVQKKTGKMFFKDCVEHHSLLYESDLPKEPKERWILNIRKEMNLDDVMSIKMIQKIKYSLIKKARKRRAGITKLVRKKIAEYEEFMDEIRENLVYVRQASTLENLHVIGIQAVKNFEKTLRPHDFEVSVLGIEREEVEQCFYAALSKDVHGYEGIDYDWIDKQTGKIEHNWKWDNDLHLTAKLDLVLDCNAAHNCIDVTQRVGSVRKLINHIYNESRPGFPEDHISLAEKFGKYYEGYPNRRVRLIYNNTMIAGEKAGLKTKAKDVEIVLKKHGFKVEMVYLGQAWEHQDTHNEWRKLLKGQLEYSFRYNKQNADVWFDACKDTETKMRDGRDGRQIKKDKSSETNDSIPAHQATHPTESVDSIVQYESQVLRKTKGGFVPATS
jgi:hypothetical protein